MPQPNDTDLAEVRHARAILGAVILRRLLRGQIDMELVTQAKEILDGIVARQEPHDDGKSEGEGVTRGVEE